MAAQALARLVSAGHPMVTLWQYLWIPLICGAALALALVVLVAAFYRVILARDTDYRSPARFWTHPIYASAGWNFTDSWVTNIATIGTAAALILTSAGSVSTLLPAGVPLDRFAILIAVCGAIIVAGPLVFAVLNTVTVGSIGVVPDNAALRIPDGKVAMTVPGGASLTFGSKVRMDTESGAELELDAGATMPVPPGCDIEAQLAVDEPFADGALGTLVFPGDSSILLTGTRTLTVTAMGGKAFTVPLGAGKLPATLAPKTTMTVDHETADAIAVKVTGFATVAIPPGTRVKAVTYAPKVFGATSLRVPLGPNVIAAQMRSMLGAGMVTMFGIGAELGILGVLAGSLAIGSSAAHGWALAVIASMAMVVLGYAIATAVTLADTRPGSALSAQTRTSYSL